MSKASQLRQKAQGFLKKGKMDKAIEEYKKLLQVESRNPNLYNELGDIYLRTNDRLQAVATFEKASMNYEKVALYNNAVAVCKKILRLVPNRLETVYKLGEIKAKQKFHGEAEGYFMRYFETVLSDPEVSVEGVQEKTENTLELLPENEGVWCRAADVFEHLGIKSRAAEVLAQLISKNSISGDPQRLNYYRSRLDILKQSLKRDELASVEKIIASAAPQAAGTTAGTADGEAPEEPADKADTGIDKEGISLTDYSSGMTGGGGDEKPAAGDERQPAGEAQAPEVKAAVEAMDQSDEEPAAAEAEAGAEKEFVIDVPEEPQPEEAEPAGQEYVIEDAGAGEVPPGPVQARPEDEGDAEQEDVIEDEGQGEDLSGAAPPQEEVSPDGAPVEQGEAEEAAERAAGRAATADEADEEEPAATVAEDLSDIIEKEDEVIESEASIKHLAEEITSDVEEDDYKSHYDLGMAYIEMGLLDDAVKELQISSRSEQLQLQSLEMIGYCFLTMNNPRLAIKQLLRGLDLANSAGCDCLGIHYNLGLAYEAMNDLDKAREHYEEVYIVDVTFRDISEKMKRFSAVS